MDCVSALFKCYQDLWCSLELSELAISEEILGIVQGLV